MTAAPRKAKSRMMIVPSGNKPKARSMHRSAHKLPPNDPQSLGVGTSAILPGPNGTGNVQITDEAYILQQEDRLVIVAVVATDITLCPEPLSGFPVTIVADGGTATVHGPIRGGTQTIPQGLLGIFVYSPDSEEWSFNIGISPGAAGVASVTGIPPITSSGGANPAIGITPATEVVAGSLSAADKTKLDSLTPGAAVASVTGTSPIASSGGDNPNISFVPSAQTTAIPVTVVKEFALVNVTASAQLITIGTGIQMITIKDRTGSPTPTIPIAAQSGALLEDPNNLGNAADFAAQVVLKQPGGAITFRFDGTIYEVVAST